MPTFSDLLVPHHHREWPLGHLPAVAAERDELCGSILDIRLPIACIRSLTCLLQLSVSHDGLPCFPNFLSK